MGVMLKVYLEAYKVSLNCICSEKREGKSPGLGEICCFLVTQLRLTPWTVA